MANRPSPDAPGARERAHPDGRTPIGVLDRVGGWLGWALLAALVLMQFVDLRDGVHGKFAVVSAYLIGFSLLSVVTLPYWVTRLRELTRTGRLVVGSFLLLLAYALVSALTERTPIIYLLQHKGKASWYTTAHLGREYYVVPVVTAIVTFLAAWGLALAVPRDRRRSLLWMASAVIAFSTLLAYPRSWLSTHASRLSTGLGGAAVVHVAFLLALGQLLGAALAGHRRVWSWLGSAVCALAILLTASRAGLICLALFAVLLALWFALRGQARLVVPLLGGLVVLFGLVIAVVPVARHLVQGHDPGRAANLRAARMVFTHDAHNTVLGAGSGRVWPWYPFETNRLPVPWEQFIKTDGGLLARTMTNPHSLLLAVFVELGLVGGALLMVTVCAVLLRTIGIWRASAAATRDAVTDPAAGDAKLDADGRLADHAGGATAARGHLVRDVVGALALVSTLPAFLFDHYLLKNFGISFWWWLVLALLLGVRAGSAPSTLSTSSTPAKLGRSVGHPEQKESL